MPKKSKNLEPTPNYEQEELLRRREEILNRAKQQEDTEQAVMKALVEQDEEPGILAQLAAQGTQLELWYLRYMIVERIGRQILLNNGYAQHDLQAWLSPYALHDEKSYVRRTAIKHLTDIGTLTQSATGDTEQMVRKKAIEQLLKFIPKADALAALNQVAANDPIPDLRLLAVCNIMDQDVITQVAKSDEESTIRQAATRKLTSQETLAWIAIHDQALPVRTTAAELMTDISALVKAAAALQPAPTPAIEEPTEEIAEE
ncbi:MAG: hypothetical protein FWE40_02840 [Oscillospiraceae bacterium]|jgi:hypothetical protein|nr:hypothetical protein [Oscillospiraceae bacterium]